MVTRPLHLIAAALLALAGCSSSPAEPETPMVQTATLTVIVWSSQVQGPVGAVGTIVSKADGSTRDIDTRLDPAAGCRLTGLPAGSFQVKIQRRFDASGKAQAVDGSEDLFLEPGSTRELTVVATDRGGELGCRFSLPGTSDAPPSPLPLAAARPAGG